MSSEDESGRSIWTRPLQTTGRFDGNACRLGGHCRLPWCLPTRTVRRRDRLNQRPYGQQQSQQKAEAETHFVERTETAHSDIYKGGD